MRDAWPGPATTVVVDDAALSTAENAAHVRAVALELGVEEVVVVTSRWHSARAAALFRRAFRGTGIRVTAAPAATAGSPRCSPARPSASSRSRCSCGAPAARSSRRAGSKRSFAVSAGTRVG